MEDMAPQTTVSSGIIRLLRILLIMTVFGSTLMLLFSLVGSVFNDQPVYDSPTWVDYASWIVPISILVIALASIGTSQNQETPKAEKTLLISLLVILLMAGAFWVGTAFANPCAPNTKTVLTSCHYAWIGKDRAGTLTAAYQIRKDGAYYVDKELRIATKIEGADVDSFMVDGAAGYAKDARHVYWNTDGVDFHILAGADRATFQFLETDPGHHYAKDSQRVYFEGQPIPSSDPDSFSVIDHTFQPRYAKDKSHVYFQTYMLPEADPATFSFVSEGLYYAKDGNRVYLRAVMIPDADPSTFQILEGGKYSRDTTHVFFTPCTECEEAKVAIIQGADAESFYVSPDEEDYIGHDKSHDYKSGKVSSRR